LLSEQFRRTRAEHTLHADERTRRRRIRRTAAALHIERHDLHRSFVERHRRQARRVDVELLLELLPDFLKRAVRRRQGQGHVEESDTLDAARRQIGRIHDESELRLVAVRQFGQRDRPGQVPELIAIGVVREDGDAVDGERARRE